MRTNEHRVVQSKTGISGVEALSLVSNRAFPRHSHDGYGIGVLLFGAHRSWSGRGSVEGTPGDIITVNPGEIHDGLPVAGAVRGWRMLYLDPAAMRRQTTDEEHGDIDLAHPALRDPEAAALLLRAFARLDAHAPEPLAIEESVVAAVSHIVRHHGAQRATRSTRAAPIARALQSLDEAPERPASLAELAALAGVSRFQLLRGFAREVGATPHAYLVQRRVGLARLALKAGAAPADAAAAAGFADQSHLTRAFVRQFGVTPARYRAAVVD